MLNTAEIFFRARALNIILPAFNVPYLPMVEPVIQAVIDLDSFALIEVARLEWMKFESRSLAAVASEFQRFERPEHVRLHLDHVPVIDEDQQRVDYLPIFQEALTLGYQSVMIDGSRLPLVDNVNATRQVVELAHSCGVPVEAELGAVLGHESGELPPYEELFASGRGFTAVDEASFFVKGSGCDWLSVGRPKELTRPQLQVLGDILDSGPVAYRFHSGVWTYPMVSKVIKEEFSVPTIQPMFPVSFSNWGSRSSVPRKSWPEPTSNSNHGGCGIDIPALKKSQKRRSRPSSSRTKPLSVRTPLSTKPGRG